MSLSVDDQQAHRFLQALAPEEQVFVFQTFDDNADRKDRTLSRVLTGTLDQMLPQLNALQGRGAGVFVQIQGGQGRGQEHITHGRAVIVDADDPADNRDVIAQIKQEMPYPSVLVQSSEGKFHTYWFVSNATPDGVRALTAEAAEIAGTDPSVKTPERVMRLPGSLHLKNPDAPTRVQLLTVRPERRYEYGQISSIFASCGHRRGARAKTGSGAVRQRFDPVFGLPISDGDDMDVLPSGDRTQKLISHIGKLVSEGYGPEYIEDEVRKLATERLPAGDKPISEASWQNEILPAIHRFRQKQDKETAQVAGTPPPPQAPMTNVPGLPQSPTAPPAPIGLPPGLNDSQPVLSEEPTQQPDTSLPMEVWVDRYVWVEEGQYVVDTTRPLSSGKYSAADFEKSHKNHRAGEGYMYNKWLGNRNRRTLRDFTFAPGSTQVVPKDGALYYNTYEAPKPLIEAFDPGEMCVFEDHMAFLFADADAWYRMTNWIIFTVQSPQKRIPWAPLLVSGEGRGKTWLYECVKSMFEGKFTASVSTEELEGQFNSYMADTLLICFEEVHTRSKHETLDKLKPIITNTTMEVNEKHGRKGQREIYANVLMTSNHDDALALQKGKDSRRYWVYEIDQPAMTDAEGARLYGWLEGRGPKHLLHWCMGVDQSDWAFNAWPEYTEAKDTMIKANMSLVTRAITEAREDGAGVFQVDIGDERQIEDTLASWLDQDRLDKRQKMELQHLIRQETRFIRRARQGKKWVRLISWRNEGMWESVPDSLLLKEYDRAKLATLGQDPGNGLAAVRGGGP